VIESRTPVKALMTTAVSTGTDGSIPVSPRWKRSPGPQRASKAAEPNASNE
jgi:hypothetical protein